VDAHRPVVEVRKLDHVALRSPDPERTAQWYERTLGLRRCFDGAFGPDSPITVAAGDGALSLVTSTTAAFAHLAFEVDLHALDAAAVDLSKRGHAVRTADHRIARSVYLSDPDGVTVELTAYLERSSS
jgi:catechol 2,3-dioxygenase-like lactoylglutathione lyase family enzyme